MPCTSSPFTQVQRVRVLYKLILKLHRGLPPEMKALGDNYMKEEFYRHKNCNPAEATIFMTEWTNYAVTLAKQMGLSGPKSGTSIGENLPCESLDRFRDDQVQQLYDLMMAAKTRKEESTNFRGVQKQIYPDDKQRQDPQTIQGVFEMAFQQFNPKNDLCFCSSSRTDSGVHALHTTAHIDLEHPRRNEACYNTIFLKARLNKYFNREHADIRVHDVMVVPNEFHARYSAIGRSYLYRLAVLNPESVVMPRSFGLGYGVSIPIAEKHRCHFVGPPFNVDKAHQAITLFQGTKDFSTFFKYSVKQKPEMVTIRTLNEAYIVKGCPMLNPLYDPLYSHFDFWDLHFKGRSFLYRQVRRMVGTVISVAQGKLDITDVQFMLDNPSPNSWNPRAVVAPAHGLYLVNVEYNPLSLNSDIGCSENRPEQLPQECSKNTVE